MTIEEKLKEYILMKYPSMREFSKVAGISNSTVDSMLSNGIFNSKASNVLKVCSTLKISADELAEGNIVSITSYQKREKILEVNEILDDLKNQMSHIDGLTLDGEKLNDDGINSIMYAIDFGIEIAKKKK